MILSGKRVVAFVDSMADQQKFPWLLDQFSQTWESPFDHMDRPFPTPLPARSSAHPTCQTRSLVTTSASWTTTSTGPTKLLASAPSGPWQVFRASGR
ncbi:PI-PLC X domain-containing protein 1 [Colletotrichum liriopes]|uniref:PI-PLC X domain-containing protein 1 n=1 Tax=Colletotrichum liriopes TaxID=708192 RepID=A0AA37LQH7_9PEZI|nr:PI-PLC X domain-containing protein 1 [Colletotrichum liriopes]